LKRANIELQIRKDNYFLRFARMKNRSTYLGCGCYYLM